jgi:hypothetical protein
MSLQLVSSQSPEPPPALVAPRESIDAAKAAQKAQRLELIAKTRRHQGQMRTQFKESAYDVVTASKMADVALTADYDERGATTRPTFHELPQPLRHRILGDMSIAVRGRRTVYKRLAEWKQRQAIADTLRELASHKLSAGEITMLAAAISGAARAAHTGVLTGGIQITPTEFAAATHNFLAEIE